MSAMPKSIFRFTRPLPAMLVLGLAALSSQVCLAQNAYDRGTPAESKSGISGLSTYAEDKLETVNLANGNLTVHIPLVTLGGRGSASYTVALNYNSKLWAGDHQTEDVTPPTGPPTFNNHYGALADDGLMSRPNLIVFSSGWSICKAPAIRARFVGIQPSKLKPPNPDFIYGLTKVWLTLPDGSEVELRDSQWEGMPLVINGQGDFDGNRGRVWHSTDGSAITYITDADNGVVSKQLGGTVYLSDGTRLVMLGALGGGSAICTKIIDRNGNRLDVTYDTPSIGDVTYADSLGRQVILHQVITDQFANSATVTVKGYNGLADRTFTVGTGRIGANLRSDFNSLQQPIINGDWDFNSGKHDVTIPHTDLFWDTASAVGSDTFNGIIFVSDEITVTSLSLLDGRSFQFQYNQFGELAQITYPGGGASQIDYGPYHTTICETGAALRPMLNRGVTERRSLSNGATVDADWKYVRGFASVGPNSYPTVTVTATQGLSGPTLLSEVHYFLAIDSEYRRCTLNASDGTSYERFENAREFRMDRQTSNGTQIEQKTWAQRAAITWQQDPTNPTISYVNAWGQENPPNDPRVNEEDTTLDNGMVKKIIYGYDAFNNETSAQDYDFGNGVAGPLLSQTTRVYAGDPGAPPINPNTASYCYTNLNGLDATCGSGIAANTQDIIHMRRLLLSETVKDGNSNLEAQTTYEYDNYTTDSNHAPVVTNSGMSSYSGSRFADFSATYQPRGNLTSVTRMIDSATNAVSYHQYDNAGNTILIKDPNGNTSTFSFADNFGDGSNPGGGSFSAPSPTFAFPTLVTNALGQQSHTQWDYTRGTITGVQDPNLVITQTTYEVYDRPLSEFAALGKAEAQETTFTYPSPGSNVGTVSKQLDASRWLSTQTIFDGFGRPLTVSHNEDGRLASSASFTISSQTIYDGLGRVVKASNPMRSITATTDGWFRHTYDLLGRVVQVDTFSGAAPPPDTGTNTNATGSVLTSFNGNQTTVVDQALKQKRSTIDGLGRLTKIEEMEPSPSTAVYATTTYGYDARGNLKTVNQGNQPQRVFSYDGLSRLKSAANPESGTVTYQYDADSNLKQKQDARMAKIIYGYDALNRLLTRTYDLSQSTGVGATPNVTYHYDTDVNGNAVTNGIGRLTSVSSSASAYTHDTFDAFGRVNQSTQTTGSNPPYVMTYQYNLAGGLTEIGYPSGKKVDTSYDGAGRISQINRPASQIYANGFTYTPHGEPASMTLGNSLINAITYNSRLQPTTIQLGTSASPASLLELDYRFNDPNLTNNNGNVLEQTIKINAATIADQNYTYDRVNRLATATETFNSATSWSRTFKYDQFGNMWVSAAGGAPGIPLSPLTPQAQSAYNPSNPNQLVASQYDQSGNQKMDGSGNGFTYDAENHQVSFNGAAGQYAYDGDGRRVTKTTSAGTTIFVYDVSGQLLAEYGGPTSTSNAGTSYLTTDHLSSTRVVTNSSGAVISRHDYLPFGEEIQISQSITIGGRTTAQGYSASDDTRQKFTSKERDNESNLDYFEARYFSSMQGRFTSPDEFAGGPEDVEDFTDIASDNPTFYADVHEPQSFNKYQYCYNNPLRYADPSGHLPKWVSKAVGTLSRTINGASSALGEDNGLSPLNAPQNSFGRAIGHGLALVQSFGETVVGSNVAAAGASETIATLPAAGSGAGAIAPATGVAVTAVGTVVIAHGAAVGANTVHNIFKKGGPKAQDAAGVTAGGQATDQHGNKLAPSGRPQINETLSTTREGGRNRALNEGSRAVEHRNPRRGQRHWHPADASGRKKPNSAHHNF